MLFIKEEIKFYSGDKVVGVIGGGWKIKDKSKVENKYNLTLKDVKQLKVGNRTQIKEPLFWRNDIIDAWCISENTIKTPEDRQFSSYNSYWLGIYDEDAKTYKGKFRVELSSYGGMCGYEFNKFFDPKGIDNKDDLEIQKMLLSKINELIDKGILVR